MFALKIQIHKVTGSNRQYVNEEREQKDLIGAFARVQKTKK